MRELVELNDRLKSMLRLVEETLRDATINEKEARRYILAMIELYSEADKPNKQLYLPLHFKQEKLYAKQAPKTTNLK